MNYKEWMTVAVKTINTDITEEIPFEIKALFEGHRWESLSTGERTGFGRYFSNEVSEGRVPNTKYYGKAKNNHNLYIKTKGEEK